MATFSIYLLRTHASMSVTGAVVGVFGVHREVLVDFDGGRKRGLLWQVTHIPTGHYIERFHERCDAMRLAKALTSASWRSPHWRFGEQPRGKVRPKYFVAAKAEALAALKLLFNKDHFA